MAKTQRVIYVPRDSPLVLHLPILLVVSTRVSCFSTTRDKASCFGSFADQLYLGICGGKYMIFLLILCDLTKRCVCRHFEQLFAKVYSGTVALIYCTELPQLLVFLPAVAHQFDTGKLGN